MADIKLEDLTQDLVLKFLETNEDGKKWLQSQKDGAVTRGLKTFEENFLKEKFPKLLDDEINKRYPAETPEQKRLKELEIKFQQVENEKKLAVLKTSLLKKATESSIPDFLVDFAVDEDEVKSSEKLLNLGKKYLDTVNAEVESRLKGGGRKAPVNNNNEDNPIELNKLPLDDPEFYKKNADALNQLMKEK